MWLSLFVLLCRTIKLLSVSSSPLGNDSGCCLLSLLGVGAGWGERLSYSWSIAVPLGTSSFSISLLCWIPHALEPMSGWSLVYSFVLLEQTAASEIRCGWKNLRFYFWGGGHILSSSFSSTALTKHCQEPA